MLNVPIRLTSITLRYMSSGCGPSLPIVFMPMAMPAQLTRMRGCAEPLRHLARLPLRALSALRHVAFDGDAADLGRHLFGALDADIEHRHLAPFAASARAVASPSPEPPPVTIAIWPDGFMRPSALFSRSLCGRRQKRQTEKCRSAFAVSSDRPERAGGKRRTALGGARNGQRRTPRVRKRVPAEFAPQATRPRRRAPQVRRRWPGFRRTPGNGHILPTARGRAPAPATPVLQSTLALAASPSSPPS